MRQRVIGTGDDETEPWESGETESGDNSGGILDKLADTTAGRQASNVADELGDGDVVGAADDFLGQKDEAIGRQFDDEAGGGFADTDTYTSILTGTNTEGTPSDVISTVPDQTRETTEETVDAASNAAEDAVDAANNAAEDAADAAAEATVLDDLLGGAPVVGVLAILGVLLYLNSDSELPGVGA